MALTPPIVSALTCGILIVIQMVLMIGVVVLRRRNKQSLGDGGFSDLQMAVRRHGNFAENAAIFLVGFALLEMMGAGRTNIEILCSIFVTGRLSHAIGLSMQNAVNIFRTLGVVATVFVGLTLGVRLVLASLSLL